MKKKEKGKVIPLKVPGRERRRVTVFLGILVMLLLVVAVFAVDHGRNWDNIWRFFVYGQEELHIDLNTGADALGEMNGSLVTVGLDGLTVYDTNGSVRFMVTAGLEDPVISCGEHTLLAYDAGGSDFMLLREDGTFLLQEKLDGAILDADLARDGACCYVSSGDRFRSVLQVYDHEQLPCYTVSSASRYLARCAVSEAADYICTVALGTEEGNFSSTAVVYRSDREEPVAELSLGNQLIYDLEFWGKKTICALGETSCIVFTTDGKVLGEIDCEGMKAFDLDGDSFGALVVPSEVGYDLITVGSNGRILGRTSLGTAAVSVDVRGKYVGYLTESGLVIAGQRLDPWFMYEQSGAAQEVCMDELGFAFLVSGLGADRYLP